MTSKIPSVRFEEGVLIDFTGLIEKLEKAANAIWERPLVKIPLSAAEASQLTPPPPPPGWAGELANFIYYSSIRPVPEVSISTSLAVLAGICGKAYVTESKSGLNQYFILVARSGVGKEAMHTGISMLINAMKNIAPAIVDFFDFSDFASGPALTKAIAHNPCFLNVAGEFGQKLKAMAASVNRPDGPMPALRKVITNLYQKSGPQSIVGGIKYSLEEKNVAIDVSVAFSMIGESTPGTFYDSLTPGMMEDGFMSRFIVFEYEGERPDENENPVQTPNPQLVNWLKCLVTHAAMLNREHKTQIVHCELNANAMLKAFSKKCDAQINAADDDEAQRQMWNRAHLKALKISALLAVADNPYSPTITTEHAQWAIDLIYRDISVFKKRLENGDIGNDDRAREAKILEIAKEYISKPLSPGYKIPDALRQAGIIPRKYIQHRTSSLSAFTSHNLGATTALEKALTSLCDSGYLQKVDETRTAERYGFLGKTYRVLDLKCCT